jgi:hypothetical protein
MALSDDDKDWLRATLENTTLKALEVHRKDEHRPLEDRLDETRRHVWIGSGVALAVGTLWNYVLTAFSGSTPPHGGN